MANSNTISILIQAKDEASAVLKSTGDSVQRTADRLNSVGQGMERLGSSMTKSLTLPMAGLAAGSLKMAGDFEQSLNILQSVTSATEQEMTTLRQTARDLGQDVSLPGISAADAAGAMTELAKAGLNVNDVLTASKGVLSLAKAGQLGVESAAMTTARALNSFGLAGTEANRIADLLAASANASTSSVEDMALGLQMVGAQSHSMGVSLEDTVTALAMFSNAGLRGSDAGTSLKQMFLQLAAPTDKAAALMKQLGLDFYNADGNFIGLSASAQLLKDKLGAMTVEQRNNALAIIFGADATRVATILAQGGAKAFDEMSVAVNKQGAATDLAAAQNKGFNGALDNLKSTAETAFIDIGTKLLPLVTRQLKNLTDMVGQAAAWFNSLRPEQQDFLFKTGVMIALLGPAILIVGKFATAIASIVTVTTAASRALGLFSTAGLVAQAGAGASALGGGAGLAGAAGRATGALVGGGGLLAALGPIGVAVAGAALVAGGAYLAYTKFKDAGKELGTAMTGAYTPVSLMTLAQQAQKRSAEEVDLATQNLKSTQEAHKVKVDDIKRSHDELRGAQDRVKAALDQFGQDSPQYQAAVAALRDQQTQYNGKLLEEWGLTGQVRDAEHNLMIKRGELKQATGDLADLQARLNGKLDEGVKVIANFGPTAINQVGSIATLQGSISSVVTAWNGWNGQLQAQLPNTTGLLQGLGSNIGRLQSQSNELNRSLQNASQLQVTSGRGLQGGGANLQGPRRAIGTNYAPGGRTLVGEHGPEYVDLPRGSKVHTAEESRNMSSGSVVNNILSGQFTFTSSEAVESFFNRLDKTQRLAQMGLA